MLLTSRRLGARTALLAAVLAALLAVTALPVHAAHEPPGGFDGDPRVAERIGQGPSRYDIAIEISRERFADGAAQSAVIATASDFADALTAGSLQKEAPLLFSDWDLENGTEHELRRVLPRGRTVYIVGGPAAVDRRVDQRLEQLGYQPVRLGGPTRIETALAVADEVVRRNPRLRETLLARAYGTETDETSAWADSITIGGFAARYEIPLLVSTRDTLHPAVDRWLRANNPWVTTLLGGEAALSADVEGAVARSRRVGGENRAGTAARIATELWGATTSGPRRFVIHNGYSLVDSDSQGFFDYVWGLPAAGFVSDFSSPMLIVHGEGVPAETAPLLRSRTCEVELRVLGWPQHVPDELIAEMDALDARCDEWTPPPSEDPAEEAPADGDPAIEDEEQDPAG